MIHFFIIITILIATLSTKAASHLIAFNTLAISAEIA